MKSSLHHTRKAAWTLTLATAALLFPASLVHAGHGHGGGRAASGGSGYSTFHGQHPYSGGFGATWGGYGYPYPGLNTFYGGYYGYGGYVGIVAPDAYFGIYAPDWGISPFGHSTMDDITSFMDSFR
jgi:hypothetical protein